MRVLAEARPSLPSVEQDGHEGVYLTDGSRLFRLVAPQLGLYPSAELEDCRTLAVDRYYCDELYAMRLHRVHPTG